MSLRAFVLATVVVALPAAAAPASTASPSDSAGARSGEPLIHRTPGPDFKPSVPYEWVELMLKASGREVDRHTPRPTILSRTMEIVVTAMYDAWAAYDDKAVGTRLGGSLRRPASERTEANKHRAIGQAAYRSLLFVYDEDADWIRDQVRAMGVDPDNESTDTTTPEGVGNVAAQALIDYRRHDGANQLGDEPGGDGKPYSDYTGYKPKNTPENVVDPTTWMPIPWADGKGGTVSPGFLTAQWYKVKPFALDRGDQFRPPPPPRFDSPVLREQVDECIRANANLTLEQKATVEFMRDGPRATGQSGHWVQFAQDISRRDHHGTDEDIKMFFAVGNVVFDAFIASWDAKRHYDTGRPYWWARFYHEKDEVEGWLGPGKGMGKLPGSKWHPYSPATFVTPPFPGHTSGHATASGAAARILELFTGSDRYGAVAIQQAGALTEADASVADMQSRYGKAGADVPATKEVRLNLPTFSATAEMAAVSRMWGGYHIRFDNDEGLILGRNIAMYSWPKYQAYFDGTAPAPRSETRAAATRDRDPSGRRRASIGR